MNHSSGIQTIVFVFHPHRGDLSFLSAFLHTISYICTLSRLVFSRVNLFSNLSLVRCKLDVAIQLQLRTITFRWEGNPIDARSGSPQGSIDDLVRRVLCPHRRSAIEAHSRKGLASWETHFAFKYALRRLFCARGFVIFAQNIRRYRSATLLVCCFRKEAPFAKYSGHNTHFPSPTGRFHIIP